VPMEGTGPRLTLATCNSFGSKDDRFIVEAKAIETRQL
jgi:sortase (surface protein transpeptidase)